MKVDPQHPSKMEADLVPVAEACPIFHSSNKRPWWRKLLCELGIHRTYELMESCGPAGADYMVGVSYFRHSGNRKCRYCKYSKSNKG